MTAANHVSTNQDCTQPLHRRERPWNLGAALLVPLSISSLLVGVTTAAIAQSAPATITPSSITPQTTVTLYVNPITGDDSTGNGSDRAPFRSITRALDVAAPNTTIQLAPGIYSSATGETFPIALKPRVIIQGNPDTRGQDVVIQGSGSFASPSLARQNITILGGANQAGLVGVTVTNPHPEGYAIQIEASSPAIAANTFTNNGRGGIAIVGSSQSVIRNNFFSRNGESSIRIQGSARPTIQENIIEQSQTGIWVKETAAPILVGNRITQNQTGIRVEGEATPKLRSNSVEGNTEFGLQAIAPARPDLDATATAEANFFRNNGKQDMALPTAATPTAKTPPAPSQDNAVEAEPPAAATRSPQPSPPLAQDPVPTPPVRKAEPGSVVVPVITIPVSQAVPSPTPVEPIAEPPVKPPAIAPTPQPQSQRGNESGLSATAFPVPSALSNTSPPVTSQRPLQVMPSNPPGATPTVMPVAASESEPPLTTITVPAVSQRAAVRPPLPMTSEGNAPQPVVTTNRRLPSQPPVRPISREEIPAPPALPLRLTSPQQPLSTAGFPVLQTPASATAFPVPAGIRPAPMPAAIPISAPQSMPVPVPLVQPLPIARPLPPATVTPLNGATSIPGAIEIPVPRPDPQPRPVRTAPARSPVAMPPIATNPTPAKPGTVLPVPSASIPVGNIGDMPKVYSARGGSPQIIPGFPMNPPNAAAVVVKYRVVVVAADESQQEQIRAIVPDAFPVVYRGQRVMQAGAFGDREKAEQLVASLSTQGLQAIVEPLQ